MKRDNETSLSFVLVSWKFEHKKYQFPPSAFLFYYETLNKFSIDKKITCVCVFV